MAQTTTTRIADLLVDVHKPDSGSSRATVMFSHGAWVGGWVWEDFAPYMADLGYDCYVPTLRGRYDSKQVEDVGSISIYDLVEDAVDVARSVDANVVIGESLGGLIAQKAAETLGLKALVLMNSAPPFMVPLDFKVMRSQIKYMGDLLFNKPNKPSKKDYSELILNNVGEPEASQFYDRICPESGRALKEASLGKIKVDPRKITCPVLSVIGHKDAILPLKAHRKVARLLGADVIEYPGMSHHTFSEEGWEKVAAEVDTWLSQKLAVAPIPPPS